MPQHFLYFFPEPQGQGSLRPTLLFVVVNNDLDICAGLQFASRHSFRISTIGPIMSGAVSVMVSRSASVKPGSLSATAASPKRREIAFSVAGAANNSGLAPF